jgi:hypothetical protein
MAKMILRLRHFQVLANLPGDELNDLPVAWNRRNFFRRTIHVNGVIAALTQKLAAVTF